MIKKEKKNLSQISSLLELQLWSLWTQLLINIESCVYDFEKNEHDFFSFWLQVLYSGRERMA